MAGEQKFVTANKNPEYEIPANERHLVHAVIEVKSFDQATGKKTSVPFVQCFYPNEFATMEEDGSFLGKSVEVIHEAEKLDDIRKEVIAQAEAESGNLGKGSLVNHEGAKQVIKTPPAKPVDVEKALGELNATELKARYKKVVGKAAAKNAKPEDLISEIQAKLKATLPKEKALAEFTTDELKAEYKKLWEEEPGDALTDAELIVLIQEKLDAKV